jgi:hypothetical protein
MAAHCLNTKTTATRSPPTLYGDEGANFYRLSFGGTAPENFTDSRGLAWVTVGNNLTVGNGFQHTSPHTYTYTPAGVPPADDPIWLVSARKVWAG